VVTVALEGLENMLRCGQSQGYLDDVINAIEACNGTSIIEELQNHDNKAVYTRATNMLEQYFGAEEVAEGGDSGEPAVVTDSNGVQQFAFNSGEMGGNGHMQQGGFHF
jgi:hypothetical protein